MFHDSLITFKAQLFSLCFLCCCLFSTQLFAQTKVLRIPGNVQGDKVRNPYVDELLRLIFAKQSIDLTIQYNRDRLSQGRALKELADGGDIDLNWSVTTSERETHLLPIRIPIYQGLIGWRTFLIHKDNQAKFAEVKSVEDLRAFIAVQRFDWPDYKILQANNLLVEGNISFEIMHKAVLTGLADYFPRSVLEIIREHKKHNIKDLVIEPSLLIKYPSAYYFFVHPKNIELAQTIESGFKKAIADGSFARLFARYHGDSLQQLFIENRHVIELNNPLFPQQN